MKLGKIKWMDLVIISVAVLIVTSSFIITFKFTEKNTHDSKRLHITALGKEYLYPLDTDGIFSIQGKDGISTIQIKDGHAQFLDSACPNKTCVGKGKIEESGQWISCLPNGVFIMIEGGGKKDSGGRRDGSEKEDIRLDAISQ